MDQKVDTSLTSSGPPSKLIALVALVIACILPFALVKLFPHKHKTSGTNIHLELPAALAEMPASPQLPITKPITKNTKPPKLVKAPKPLPEKEWRIIKTRYKDTFITVFNRTKINKQFLNSILKDNPHCQTLKRLKPNQDIQFLIKYNVLKKVIIPLTTTQYLVIYQHKGHYKTKIKTKKMNSHNHFLTATIQGSFFATAKRLKIAPKLIQQMIDIFTWDINFSRDVRPGDRFTIIYKAYYIEDKQVGTGDIIAVTYSNRNNTFQAIRHVDRQGQASYYTPEGRSLRKAFNRYPVRFSHISSTFSLARYHPVLHYRRPHKGVDLAASIGTPIQATGDGRITMIGRQNGYGNMITIAHNKMYSTIYGHMLKFQKGLSRGDYVKRGQVIGYVGQSGLASGPHCHYEFRINNQPKNPSTISLPRGEPISSRELAFFQRNSRTLLAQLKLFEDGHHAHA